MIGATGGSGVHFLIIGGGSAGCVLAARLSEVESNRVTLVEAGRDLTEASMAPHVRTRYPGRAYIDDNNIWPDLKAYLGAAGGASRAPRRYEQGRLLGGGSSVNAMVANRGAPDDYDEWGRLGAAGWSWDAALPYFRKLERDVDFGGPYHGKDGPIPIRRISDARMSPLAKGVIASLKAQGYPHLPDQNGKWEDGIFVGAIALSDRGERIPTHARGPAAPQPRDHHRTPGREAGVRRTQGDGRGHRALWRRPLPHHRRRPHHRLHGRDPFPGPADAERRRSRRGAGQARHLRRARQGSHRAEPDGAFIHRGEHLSAARHAHDRSRRASRSRHPAVHLEPARRPRR
jgi:choline dehydrogenase-like flavoprotein